MYFSIDGLLQNRFEHVGSGSSLYDVGPMPEHKTLEAESVAQVFLKLVHFFDKFSVDFK